MSPEKKALTMMMYVVFVEIRMLGWNGVRDGGLSKEDSELVANLADAVHNLPHEILSKEELDIKYHVEYNLKGFDKRNDRVSRINLYNIYKSYLKKFSDDLLEK